MISASRATPEPPAGPREYLMDPPSIAYGLEENRVNSELALRADGEEVQENREEDSSLLHEVLSSLKSPIAPCLPGVETEDVVLVMKEETKEKKIEEVETDGREEEAGVDEPLSYQAASFGPLSLGQTTEEKEEVSTPSCQEVVPIEEEENGEEEEDEEEEATAADEEEEELVVELFSQHGVCIFR